MTDLIALEQDLVATAHGILDRTPSGTAFVAGVVEQALDELKASVVCDGRRPPIAARAELLALHARVDVRLGRARAAFDTAYKTLFWLERQMGRREMLAVLRAPSRSAEASSILANLEVYGTTMGAVPESTRAHCMADGRELVMAYAAAPETPVRYARTEPAALVWLRLLEPGPDTDRLARLTKRPAVERNPLTARLSLKFQAQPSRRSVTHRARLARGELARSATDPAPA